MVTISARTIGIGILADVAALGAVAAAVGSVVASAPDACPTMGTVATAAAASIGLDSSRFNCRDTGDPAHARGPHARPRDRMIIIITTVEERGDAITYTVRFDAIRDLQLRPCTTGVARGAHG